MYHLPIAGSDSWAGGRAARAGSGSGSGRPGLAGCGARGPADGRAGLRVGRELGRGRRDRVRSGVRGWTGGRFGVGRRWCRRRRRVCRGRRPVGGRAGRRSGCGHRGRVCRGVARWRGPVRGRVGVGRGTFPGRRGRVCRGAPGSGRGRVGGPAGPGFGRSAGRRGGARGRRGAGREPGGPVLPAVAFLAGGPAAGVPVPVGADAGPPVLLARPAEGGGRPLYERARPPGPSPLAARPIPRARTAGSGRSRLVRHASRL